MFNTNVSKMSITAIAAANPVKNPRIKTTLIIMRGSPTGHSDICFLKSVHEAFAVHTADIAADNTVFVHEKGDHDLAVVA